MNSSVSLFNFETMTSEQNGKNNVCEESPLEAESEEKKWKLDFLKKMSVEPCVFLFSLGFAFINIQMPTLYVMKTCKVGSYFFGNETFSTEVKN